MKPVLYLSAAVLVAVCATWAYRVNYAAQEALDRVEDLRLRIAQEREALGVLRAEWAYLNRPDRLRALVAAQGGTLGLTELVPEQFGDAAMIAYPPEPEVGAEPARSVDPAASLRPRDRTGPNSGESR